jgi:cytochrome P450 family 142 subfamily A polypeptide 1
MAGHPLNPNIRLADGRFFADDPHPHFRWMREHAPVYRDESSGFWGVALYDDVMAVSKDPQTFSNGAGSRPDFGPMSYMIDRDDPEHKRRRNLVNKGFTVRRVLDREPRIRAVCVDLIERARERRRFDFVNDVAAWLPLIVIGDMLGVEPEAYPDLLRWSDEMLRGTGTPSPEAALRAADAFEGYLTYQRRVLADRRSRSLQPDLVSILVHAEIDGDKLDDESILMEALLILIGGDETTRHVLSGGMYELLRRPDQLRLLAEDPARIPTAVEEMLRWVSPVQNMARTAARDVELHGQEIRKGDKLLLLYPSANRDETVFRQADRFDVERAPNEHIAFGYGAHYCLGASLARLELRVMFEEILTRMPQLALVSDCLPPRRASNFICGFEEMPVEIRG